MFTINATSRSVLGKGASRRLRRANKFPAVVYGGKETPISIELDHNTIIHMQEKDNFYSSEITLVIDAKPTKVKVQAVQRHPFKPKLTHIDFVRI